MIGPGGRWGVGLVMAGALVAAAPAARAQDTEVTRGEPDLEAVASPNREAPTDGPGEAPAETPPVRWTCIDGVPRLAEDPDAEHRFIPSDTPLQDWAQLATGETLGGEFLRMRDGNVEFDSDEMGVVTLDWEDLLHMRVTTPHTYVREDLVPFRGKAALGDGELVVCTLGGEARLAPGEVLSVVEGDGRERDRWTLAISAGYSGAFGNARQHTVNGQVRIRREDRLSRLSVGYDVNYSEASVEDSDSLKRVVENMWGHAALDFFVSRRFYITAAQGRVGYDWFQNIELRATPGAGVGVRILDGGPDWDVELGGGYQFTRFRTVQADRDETSNDAGVRIATFLSVDITSDLEFEASHEASVVVTDLDQSHYLTKAMLSYDLGDVDVHVSLYWDRLRRPEQAADGTRPDPDSLTVTAGLTVSL